MLRQHSLRASNLGLVMQAVVAAEAPSRADIAAVTGMTRSTVSRLADELIAGGLVVELDPLSGNRGRPATPLVPARGAVAAIGCEVAVTHITVRIIDLAGEVLSHRHAPQNLAGIPAPEALQTLAAMVSDCVAEVSDIEIVGLGLAIPGLVAAESQQVLEAPNLRWYDLALPPLLAEAGISVRTDAPAAGPRESSPSPESWPLLLVNEADAAAVAVAQSAPGRSSGRDAFLYVSGEIGIGSAVVSRGEVAGGRHGWAGELGHVCVDPAGETCGCGASGCLETVAGSRAVLRDSGAADLGELREQIAAEQPETLAVVRRAGRALGVAIAGALNLLDLQDVVLGGFLADVGPLVLPEIDAELQRRVLSARFSPVAVSLEEGGEWHAATGAAYGCLATVISDPAGWLDGRADTMKVES